MSAELKPGQKVGNYVIQSQLGHGGMGAVYLAQHPQIGRRVAVKVLAEHLGSHPQAAERFIAEAKAVNQIEHPNIIDVYDFGRTDDGRLYCTMEVLRGRELGAVMQQGAMNATEIVPYVQQICSALTAAHGAGVVHRDLKPENIFVLDQQPMMIKVLDFGIAKLLEPEGGGASLTSTGMILGSPLTIAPEQAAGQPDRIGPHTDVYSLGVILFWMLSGRPPFALDAPGILLAKHITEQPPQLGSVSAVPAPIAALVDACLSKEPAQRPTAEQVSRGLTVAPQTVIGPAAVVPRTVIQSEGKPAVGTDFPPTVQRPPVTTLSAAAAEAAGPAVASRAGANRLWVGVGAGVVTTAVAAVAIALFVGGSGNGDPRPKVASGAATESTNVTAAKPPAPDLAVVDAASAPVKKVPPVKKAPPPVKRAPVKKAVVRQRIARPVKLTRATTERLRDWTREARPRFSYVARISERDHFNRRGRRLRSAAAIIRQDRANFHLYRVRDSEDRTDRAFHKKARRALLPLLLRRGIPPRVARIIRRGTPLVRVLVWDDRAAVQLISR